MENIKIKQLSFILLYYYREPIIGMKAFFCTKAHSLGNLCWTQHIAIGLSPSFHGWVFCHFQCPGPSRHDDLKELKFNGISRPTYQNQRMEITPLELGIALASMSLQEHLHRVKVELFALQKGVHVEAMG